MFSETCASSSKTNGGVCDRFKILSSETITSISPVFMLGLIMPSGLSTTVPRTASTNSLRMAWALSWTALLNSGLKTTWVIPSRSRKSTKITPPWSRRRSTQPMSTTSSPTFLAVNCEQWWVRFKFPRESSKTGSFQIFAIYPYCYSLSEKDFGAIDFFRKREFVPYSQQILDARSWILG